MRNTTVNGLLRDSVPLLEPLRSGILVLLLRTIVIVTKIKMTINNRIALIPTIITMVKLTDCSFLEFNC